MTAPINLYANDTTEPTDNKFMPATEAGTGYRMRLFSIKDRPNCWQCTFETGDQRLYSQKFWKEGRGATKLEALEAIRNQWITCDIELTEKGFQRIFNEEIEDAEPTPQTTAEYLDSMPTQPAKVNDDVPF